MRPVTRIILVFILSAALCEAAYFPISRGMAKYHWNNNKRLNEILNGHTSYDILFIGSSRTYRNIYPRVIDSICQVNSYNAGARAAKMTEMKMYFDGYCVHHPFPKILVLNLDGLSFAKTDDIFNSPQYFSFLNNPAVYNTLSGYDNRVRIVKRLPFLGLADFDDASKINAVKSLLGMQRTELLIGEFEYKGYLASTDIEPNHTLTKPGKVKKGEITNTAVEELESIINTCKNHHTKLIFTYAPEYNFHGPKLISNTNEIIALIKQIAQKNNVDFIRYDSLPMCNDAMLFFDGTHLNREGAVVYSRIQAEDIKAIMQQGK